MQLLIFIFQRTKALMEIGNFCAGILLIIAGIYTLYFTYNHPDRQLTNTQLRGFFGGIGLIIGGIMFIFGQVSISDF